MLAEVLVRIEEEEVLMVELVVVAAEGLLWVISLVLLVRDMKFQ